MAQVNIHYSSDVTGTNLMLSYTLNLNVVYYYYTQTSIFDMTNPKHTKHEWGEYIAAFKV